MNLGPLFTPKTIEPTAIPDHTIQELPVQPHETDSTTLSESVNESAPPLVPENSLASETLTQPSHPPLPEEDRHTNQPKEYTEQSEEIHRTLEEIGISPFYQTVHTQNIEIGETDSAPLNHLTLVLDGIPVLNEVFDRTLKQPGKGECDHLHFPVVVCYNEHII